MSEVTKISRALATNIDAAREGRMIRSDDSVVSARHLKTREDLSAFYGCNDEAQANWVVAGVTYMLSVAAGALFVAAVGGHEARPENDSTNWDFDLSGFSIDELLNTRCALLA